MGGGYCSTLLTLAFAVLLLASVVPDAAAQNSCTNCPSGIIGEPPQYDQDASVASGELRVTLPNAVAGLPRDVTHGLDVYYYGGTARVGRYCHRSGIYDIAVSGNNVHFGTVSLGGIHRLSGIEICARQFPDSQGFQTVDRTLEVQIVGKTDPNKSFDSVNPVPDSWTDSLKRDGYTATFKPASHCGNIAAYWGGPSFAGWCKVRFTFTK